MSLLLQGHTGSLKEIYFPKLDKYLNHRGLSTIELLIYVQCSLHGSSCILLVSRLAESADRLD